MRAVVVNQAITGIEVMDHEKPALVAHGQALVKVEYCGVAILTFMQPMETLVKFQVVSQAMRELVLLKKLVKGLKH